MRRLTFILLAFLIVAPAGLAAPKATGDGVLELRDVDAQWLVIRGVHGAIWGQMDKGTLTVTDLDPTDSSVPFVNGAEQTRPSFTDPSIVVYKGNNIHFRFSGGRYKFSFVGSGIDLTAVGAGNARLLGDPASDDPGRYAIDGNKWQVVPSILPRFVAFGAQPTQSSP